MLKTHSAREIPWRSAFACEATPPPSIVATTSNLSVVSVIANGCRATSFSVSWPPKES